VGQFSVGANSCSSGVKRRQAIKPIIGHLTAGHRFGHCPLNCEQGDILHAVLCAADYNIRWPMRMNRHAGG
jgi:IS5 family transposase